MTKLTFSVLFSAILIVVLGLLCAVLTENSVKTALGEQAVILAQQVHSKIHHSLQLRITEFEDFSHDNQLRQFLTESNSEFEREQNIHEKIQTIDSQWTNANNFSTKELIEDLRSNALARLLKAKVDFHDYKNKYSVWPEIFVTNIFGVNVALTNITTDYYHADEHWWQQTVKKGLFISDLEYDESAGVIAINICVRVDDERGNFIGVIKTVLNAQEIYEIIDVNDFRLQGRADTKIAIFDEQQNFVASSGFDKRVRALAEIKNYKQSLQLEIENHDRVKVEDSYSFLGGALVAHAHSCGIYKLGGFDWIVVIHQNVASFLKPVTFIKRLIVFALMLIGTIYLWLGLILTKALAIPLKNLKSAFVAVGKGGLDTQVQIIANDELGDLSRDFNKMATELKTYYYESMRSQTKMSNLGFVASELAHEVSHSIQELVLIVKRVQNMCLSGDGDVYKIALTLNLLMDSASYVTDVVNSIKTLARDEEPFC